MPARNAHAHFVFGVERADDPVEPLAACGQPQLLRVLLDVVRLQEFQLARGRRIDVDVERAVEVHVAGNAGERRCAEIGVHRQSDGRVVDLVHALAHPIALERIAVNVGVTEEIRALRVVDVAGEDRRARATGQRIDRAEEFGLAHLRARARAFDFEIQVEAVARRERELQSPHRQVAIADRLARQPAALPVTFVLLDRLAAEAQRGRVAERHIDGALEVQCVVVAVAESRVGVESLLRLARDDIERAGSRVAAVQRALRSLQHFDALEIEHVERHHRDGSDVHLVDVDAGARAVGGAEIVEPDAADRDDRHRTRHLLLDVEVRHAALEIENLLDALLRERVRR